MSNVETYDWQAVGLTPQYVKTTLEDLARDQVETEGDLDNLTRKVNRLDTRTLVLGVGVLGCFGIGFFTVKLVKKMADNMQQLGMAVMATQEAIGMTAKVAEPRRSPVTPTVRKEEPKDETVASGGDTYDPGPQEVSEDVKRAVLADPVPDPYDDGPVH